MWRYYALWLAVHVIAPLPSWAGHALAGLMGEIGYLAARRSRARLEDNLRRALGPNVSEGTLRRVARACFRNLASNYYDLIRIPRLSPRVLDRRVEFAGFEHVQRALAAGRGVVLATAHLGNLDLVAQAALARSVPMTVLVERLKPEKVWRYCMRLRTAQGLSVLPAEPPGVRAAFRALRRGEAVAIACDRAVHGVGIAAPFMGEPAVMPVGAAQLALRTHAALLPCFCVRTGRDRYRVTFEPPIPLALNGRRPTAEDVRHALGEVIAVMERYIKAHPEQWMLFQPLWEAQSSTGTPEAMPIPRLVTRHR